MSIQTMITTHPDVRGNVNSALVAAIDEASDCALACTSCADACLAESMVEELRQCIRLNLDCADVCAATATVAMRRSGGNVPVIRAVLEACIVACERCGEECAQHAAQHEHCEICAEACQRCADACRRAEQSLQQPSTTH